MPAPKLNKPEGLAALINASIQMAARGISAQDSFNWNEILKDFQEYNCQNWLKESRDEPRENRESFLEVEFKEPQSNVDSDNPGQTLPPYSPE